MFISDTHCQMDMVKYKVPSGDVLIHSGDWTYQGTVREFVKEIQIFNELPHEFKIVIAGNHDRLAQRLGNRFMAELCKPAIYLHNESCVINDIKFYGSASTPRYGNWAFGLKYTDAATEWAKIDNDTEILITHGPPFNQCDMTPRGEAIGCGVLGNRIQGLQDLRIHAFGHCHHGYGLKYNYSSDRLFINASICNEQYYPNNWPIVIDYNEETKEIFEVQYHPTI